MRLTILTAILIVATNSFVLDSLCQEIEQATKELGGQILASLQAKDAERIAVIEFSDLSGQITPLGRLLSEELIGQLFASNAERFQIVERSKLEEVLGEQRLGVNGLLEQKNVQTFGKVLGVEAILTGTVAVFEHRLRINSRLIAVPSGQIFATAHAYMSRDGISEDFLKADSDAGQEDNGEPGSTMKPVATREVSLFTFDLLSCIKATRLITCEVVVTNNGADRYLELDARDTFLYDQRGYKFTAVRVRAGELESGSNFRKFFITEIPTEVTVFFEGVPSTIEFIKILGVQFDSQNLEFRDVRFSER